METGPGAARTVERHGRVRQAAGSSSTPSVNCDRYSAA